MHEMGATVAPPVGANFGGVPLRAYPKVVFSPAFAPTIDALKVDFHRHRVYPLANTRRRRGWKSCHD